ncbi:MAG: hypothetical protein ACRD0S_01845 [Acidimicrobiales bacterium]
MSCPKCKTSSITAIALNIGDRPVRMRNCSGCDTRWWDSDGESLPLHGVLELARR